MVSDRSQRLPEALFPIGKTRTHTEWANELTQFA